MRLKLVFNLRLLSERIAFKLRELARLRKLKGTPASALISGHIDSMELLELGRELKIDVIYDIGANVGTWTLLAKAIIPSAIIDAFEPFPKHCDQFKSNVSGLKNINLHSIALGAENATMPLHVTDFSDASSLLPPTPESKVQFGVNEVEKFETGVWRLDDYRVKHNLALPDLIKLDVQGYELQVLKGAPLCLQAAKAIITEVSFVQYYKDQCYFHEIVELLASYGLFLAAVGVNTPFGEKLKQTDVLFLREGMSCHAQSAD